MRKNRLLIILALLFTAIMVVSTGCRNYNQEKEAENEQVSIRSSDNNSDTKNDVSIHNEASIEYLRIDEAIKQSYCVVSARLNNIIERERDREYEFSLVQTIVGTIEDNFFY